MTSRYETLVLASPSITGDEKGTFQRQLEKVVKDQKGSIISFDDWGKCRLAYPVRKNDYGVYFLLRFEAEKAQMKEIATSLKSLVDVKFNEVIMRYATMALHPKQGLEYRRPASVDTAPTRDVDQFLRDNKMESLKSVSPAEEKDAPKVEAAPAEVKAENTEATTEETIEESKKDEGEA